MVHTPLEGSTINPPGCNPPNAIRRDELNLRLSHEVQHDRDDGDQQDEVDRAFRDLEDQQAQEPRDEENAGKDQQHGEAPGSSERRHIISRLAVHARPEALSLLRAR
jgi:hypothetical protein